MKDISEDAGQVVYGCDWFEREATRVSCSHCFFLYFYLFSQIYSEYAGGIDTKKFVRRLWGDFYYDEETRTFSNKSV